LIAGISKRRDRAGLHAQAKLKAYTIGEIEVLAVAAYSILMEAGSSQL
jgi:hypothetical protein